MASTACFSPQASRVGAQRLASRSGGRPIAAPGCTCKLALGRRHARSCVVTRAAAQDAAEPPKEALWQAAPGAPAAEAAAPASKAAHAAAKEAPRVLVGFSVPGCALALGEHLRVVGSCPELGGWDPAAAPPLAWHEGHRWAGEVPLPPGQHAWKLVVLRPDGGQRWEEGANRELRIPELAAGAAAVAAAGAARAAAAAAAGPLLRATARFGDTTATAVAADHSRLHAAAQAASARVAALLARKSELAGRLAALEAEVEQSENTIAGIKAGVQKLVASELARLEARKARAHQRGREQLASAAQQRAELAEASAAADAVHASAAAVEAAAGGAASNIVSTERALLRAKAEERAVAAAAARAAEPALVAHGSSSGAGDADRQPQLAARVQSLRQEVVSEARQAAKLAEDFERLVSLRRTAAAAMHNGSAAAAGASVALAERPHAALPAHVSGGGSSGRHSGEHSGRSASRAAVPAAAPGGRATDPLKKHNTPGAALCLAASSLFTLGGLAWSVGRALVPAGARATADAAFVLASLGAAAVPFL